MKVLSIKKKIFGNKKYYPRGMNSLVDTSVPDFVEIGKNFVSAPGSIVLAHDASTITHCDKLRVEKTIIKDNVFLGANAVILPGITVGNNVIIGARAIVTKDVPDGMVVAGNPAKIISTVDKYIQKCNTRGVLYSVPLSILKKRGTMLRYTQEETFQLSQSVIREYMERIKKVDK